ncbi:MAG: SDR family NAD(P)-dependent oxidoreductase [Actinomycetota bacterium]
MESFEGVIAVMTGGGGGIGRSMCIELAARGAHLTVSDHSLERAEETVEACLTETPGATVQAARADVTSTNEMRALAVLVRETHGTAQLVFANAGVSPPVGNVVGRTRADWDFALGVNLFGAINTVDAFVDHLRTNAPDARLMVTASMGGLQSTGTMSLGSYIPSKFACIGYCLEIQRELGAEGIDVSILVPGLVYTAMTTNSAEVRPAHLGKQAAPKRIDMPPALRPLAVMPADAARSAIDGLRAGHRLIATHADSANNLRDYYAAIVEELDGQGVEAGID